MKFNIEIDCTPEEARRMFGLPDVSKMNEDLVARFQARMSEAVSGSDPETLMKTWLTTGMAGFEQMQKSFWSNFAKAAGRDKDK